MKKTEIYNLFRGLGLLKNVVSHWSFDVTKSGIKVNVVGGMSATTGQRTDLGWN